MSYHVAKKEKVSDAVRRIAAEEIHAVIAELHSVPLQPENIHDARRHLKKIRALLQLVREPFSSAAFKKENQAFRDAGQMLAPVRDAQVTRKALASVLASFTRKVKPDFLSLSAAFPAEADRREIGKAERAKITKSLRAALGRVENWPLAKFGRSDVRSALKRSFRRCQKCFHHSSKTERSEAFHEWRKRVKVLEYHLCLVEIAWRKKTKRTFKKIRRLDDCLGEDHDLALLLERLRGFKFENDELQNRYREIVAEICRRRAKLQHRALTLGNDLLKRRPGNSVCRTIRDAKA